LANGELEDLVTESRRVDQSRPEMWEVGLGPRRCSRKRRTKAIDEKPQSGPSESVNIQTDLLGIAFVFLGSNAGKIRSMRLDILAAVLVSAKGCSDPSIRHVLMWLAYPDVPMEPTDHRGS
jgi:hypothetical protein